jgi:hypothetical protein
MAILDVRLCAAITPDIAALDKAFQNLFRNILSPLKVNMNIRTFYRVAPKRFQGLGMPNPLITMLSQKLHLLQTQFNQPTATGRMLQQSLEVFQMEVGLRTNILEEDFSRLGNLATDGWWKHLWQLCHKFRVTFAMSRKWQFCCYGQMMSASWVKSVRQTCLLPTSVYGLIEFASIKGFTVSVTSYSVMDALQIHSSSTGTLWTVLEYSLWNNQLLLTLLYFEQLWITF